MNNKGFAISSMIYSILLLFLMLILGVFILLGSRKVILDKVKNDIVTELSQNRVYELVFEHKNILLANTSKVNGFTFDLLDGVRILDQNGEVVDTNITVESEPAFDSTKNGVYQVRYSALYQGYEVETDRTIEVIDPVVYEYDYIGEEQLFNAPTNGVYKTELWGASGGSISGIAYHSNGTVRNNNTTYTGGKGAYTTGNLDLALNDRLYVYVGGTPEKTNTTLVSGGTSAGGYNGGISLIEGQEIFGAAGGGASDIRLVNGSWANFDSLKSRIMVAGGGGGANFRNQGYGEGNGGSGGGLTGIDGKEALVDGSYFREDWAAGYSIGTGGTQIGGGITKNFQLNGTKTDAPSGTFGGLSAPLSQSGGGGGYYSGASSSHGGAGGGSSYISGYKGCDSIAQSSTSESITHTGGPIHYSKKVFQSGVMKTGDEEIPTHDGSGVMIGNTGNGYAKITALIIDNGKLATNLIKNSSFENGSTNWSLSNSKIVTDQSKSGNASLEFQPSVTSMSIQTMDTPISNHIYYGSMEFLSSNSFTTSDNRFEWYLGDVANSMMVFARKGDKTEVWKKLSSRLSLDAPNSGSWKIRNFLVNASEKAYADDLFIIDLTEIYGAGNEPTKEWCDEHITYFDGIGIVPGN